jgi:surface antigen
MRWIPIVLVAALAGGACQPPLDAGAIVKADGQTQPAQASSQPDCREFTAPVTTGGQPEQARGRACRQPDGSWQVVQNTPGLPSQEYLFPRPEQTPPPPAQTASTEPTSPQAPPACTTYTVAVSVGGRPEQAVVEACPQADGGWRITQTTQGLPPQVYDVPPPPAHTPYSYDYAYAYPDYFPYWWGAPWFFGLAPSIVVVQHFHHFHHGFGHGFMHGMHGFAHGFTGVRGGTTGGGHR